MPPCEIPPSDIPVCQRFEQAETEDDHAYCLRDVTSIGVYVIEGVGRLVFLLPAMCLL